MATGYGVCVYVLYGHCAISFTGLSNRPVQNRRDRAEIVRKSCGHRSVSAAMHFNHMDTVRHRAALVRRPHRERKAKGVKGKRSKGLHPETEMQDDPDIDQS